MTATDLVVLTEDEAARRSELESCVDRGLGTFIEVGTALTELRESRLYRDTHGTWAAYVEERWQMTKRRADQLVAAAAVGTMVPITSERQARELAGLAPDDQQTVYDLAYAHAMVTRGSSQPNTADLAGAREVWSSPRPKVATSSREDEVIEAEIVPPILDPEAAAKAAARRTEDEALAGAKLRSEDLRVAINLLTKAFGTAELREQVVATYVTAVEMDQRAELLADITADHFEAAAKVCLDLAERWGNQ